MGNFPTFCSKLTFVPMGERRSLNYNFGGEER
jgi:hypothetical protein